MDDVFLSDLDNTIIILLCVTNLHVAFARVCHRLEQSGIYVFIALWPQFKTRSRIYIIVVVMWH